MALVGIFVKYNHSLWTDPKHMTNPLYGVGDIRQNIT